jgi:hypothetical protein
MEKMECSFCFRDLNLGFYIQCAECARINLCVDCFSAGVTLENHENYHSYKIPDCLDFPVFAKEWTIKEEIFLLEGLLIILYADPAFYNSFTL